jgi:Peptidase family M28
VTRALWLSLLRIALGVAAIVVLTGAAGAWIIRGPFVGRVEVRPVDAAVSVERLRSTVETLAGRFRTRWITHPETLESAADWIAERMRSAGLEVAFQSFDLREGQFRNVVGVRQGVDASAPLLVVGAHYDAYGEMPGADDNASGVAGLLELATTLEADVPRTVHFVAFVNEEPPFFGGDDMGSMRYARALAERGTDVGLMISLEMIGCYSDAPGSQRYPLRAFRLVYPDRGNFLAVVGDLGSTAAIREVKRALLATDALPIYSFRGPRWIPGVDWSDHSSFRRFGFRAVMVTDTAFLRNPRYHTRHDTPDTLDYVRMAAAVRALHGVLRSNPAP